MARRRRDPRQESRLNRWASTTKPNRYSGLCNACKINVPAGDGAVRREGGRWAVYCLTCDSEAREREEGENYGAAMERSMALYGNDLYYER